jgi:hypothetical protein
MKEAMHSLRITHLSWGRLEVEDGSFKDVKLINLARLPTLRFSLVPYQLELLVTTLG